MKKNMYITPNTDIMEVAATNVLMVSVSNDPLDNIIGG